MQPKVSFIIPVYNVESYLDECLSSVVNQTYRDIEIIVVDDKGIDSSMEIVKKFADKDNRLRILSYGENKGVSFARNFGLQAANGEYIIFIDSDDFIDLDYVKVSLNHLDKNIDVLQNNNYVEYYYEGKQLIPQTYDVGDFEVNNKNKHLITLNIWNKIYRRDFLLKNNILFPEGIKMGEDLYFNSICTLHLDKIRIYNGSTYYYRQNIYSATKKLKNENDILDTFKMLHSLLKENNALSRFSIPFFHLRRHLKNSRNKSQMFKEIKEFFTSIKDDIYKNIHLYSKKDLIFFHCVAKSNSYFICVLYIFLYKIIKNREIIFGPKYN